MRVNILGAVAVVALVAGLADAAPARRPDGVPFDLDAEGGVVVKVAIDGRGPFRFLLDTGSSRMVLSERVAQAVQAPVVAKSDLLTATGKSMRPVVRLEQTSLGSVVVTQLAAVVVPQAELPGQVDGILAQDLLDGVDYTLDYRHRRLVWAPAEDDGPPGARVKLERSQGRFLARLPQNDGVRDLLFVPDSGAAVPVVFGAAVRLPWIVELPGAVTLNGIATAARVTPIVIPRLIVGNTVLRYERGVLLEHPERDAPEGDGLLPLHLFSSVTFHTRGGYLVVRR